MFVEKQNHHMQIQRFNLSLTDRVRATEKVQVFGSASEHCSNICILLHSLSADLTPHEIHDCAFRPFE